MSSVYAGSNCRPIDEHSSDLSQVSTSTSETEQMRETLIVRLEREPFPFFTDFLLRSSTKGHG